MWYVCGEERAVIGGSDGAGAIKLIGVHTDGFHTQEKRYAVSSRRVVCWRVGEGERSDVNGWVLYLPGTSA